MDLMCNVSARTLAQRMAMEQLINSLGGIEVANSQYSTVSYEVEDGQTVAFIAQKESIDKKIQMLFVTKSRSGRSGMQSTHL